MEDFRHKTVPFSQKQNEMSVHVSMSFTASQEGLKHLSLVPEN